MKFTFKSCIGKTWAEVSSSMDDFRSLAINAYEVDIRNPKAVMRNLKATVGIKLKLKGGLKSFCFILPSAAGGYIDVSKEEGNERVKNGSLSEIGLKNRDLIYLIRSDGPEMDLVNFLIKCCDENRAAIEQEEPHASDHISGNDIRNGEGSSQQLAKEATGGKRPRSDQKSSVATVQAEPATAQSRGSSSSSIGSDDDHDSLDEEDWEDALDLDSEDIELGEIDGLDEEGAEMLIDLGPEQLEMLRMILDLPEAESLLEKFATAPEEVMQTVQSSKPELFQLITENHQIFLQLMEAIKTVNVNGSNGLVELREFADMLSAMNGTSAVEDDEVSGPTVAVSELELGEEDVPKITSLMELGGFSREQCVRALVRCDRDMERAANFLFENFTC